MAAITKTWTDIADASLNPDAPITTTLMYAMRDDLQFLHEWMGYSYYAGAVRDHNHDGVNSASIPIGANYLRNGSFESGTAGWTITQFSGGTVVTDTTNEMDGGTCLAVTSTLLANGGGSAQTSEYEPCGGGMKYSIRGLVKASVANVSSNVDVIWFDATKAQISTTNVYNSASTPTAEEMIGSEVSAPANARYKQLKLTGGVAGVGTAVGTVYFDGFVATRIVGGLIKFTQITASGTFTPDPNTQTIVGILVGGGGPGAAANGSDGGLGGHAGSINNFSILGPLAATYAVTIGAGGTGAGNGGTTYFGSFSAPGGRPGSSTTSSTGTFPAGSGENGVGQGGAPNIAAAANTGAGGGGSTSATVYAGGSGIAFIWEFA